MTPLRRLPLPGLYNARDLGGFPTADGGRTRFGVFVRSEAPCELPRGTVDALVSFGLTGSLDLRSTDETLQRPSSLRGVMSYYHRPLFNEDVAFDGGEQKKGPPPVGGDGFDWGKMYCSMAGESRAWAVETLRLAAEEPGALLYHCTTGKDRTGILTCYLLSIAGVAPADIAADYCVSELYLQPVYAKLRTLLPGARSDDDPFFHTPASAMYALIDGLTAQHGSVTAFLRDAGVPEETFLRIRDKLVEH